MPVQDGNEEEGKRALKKDNVLHKEVEKEILVVSNMHSECAI